MEDLVQAMKQSQITREAQFAQDIALLRAELGAARAAESECKQRLEQTQNELAQTRLELSTALAASQIRVEQLQNMLQDQKYEHMEIRQERSRLQSQLDAAREEYLILQR